MATVDRFLPAYSSSEDACPICKSSRYLNPNMKLLVPPCFHKMCEACIDRIFSLGPAPCPVCQQILRKTNFWTQKFEDLQVERELQIRKRIAKFFNKRTEDFKSLRLYNDYLEEVEELTFNLINGVDVQETEERIQRFAQENRDLIASNAARQQREERMLNHRLKQERSDKEHQRQLYLQQLEEEEVVKRTQKNAIINQLASSNQSASEIVARNAITLKKSSMAPSAARATPSSSGPTGDWMYNGAHLDDDEDMDIDSEEFDPLSSLYCDVGGFELKPEYYDPMASAIQNPQMATAGGYLTRFSHQRSLEAAFTGLLIPPLSDSIPSPPS
ncbi:TFIIH/NER complex subunit [Dimargaris verticillata]|uniref:RNA polymerase II transcription factor B subunit 3 n=1 Tax=Dimargaris verticillata TaxID=2761393 RepID=A0A9W8BAE1_9FUNG|nr:TFIIH/NER complex subunit [Dimargaris verticillata]